MTTFYRIIGYIGRAMMSTGVILLLFVVYELWGTAIHTARAQEDKADEFAESQREYADRQGTSTTTVTAPVTTADTAVPPSTTDTTEPGQPVGWDENLKPLAAGDPIGRMKIPAIGGKEWIAIEGVSPLSLLKAGPGHFPDTPRPGQPGNSAIAGHRTTYGAPFNRIDELKAGDLIEFETVQGKFTYEVFSPDVDKPEPSADHVIVKPWDNSVIKDQGDNRITLIACEPEYSARLRIVVFAKLVSNPALPSEPTTGEPATDEPPEPNAILGTDLEGGDSTAWPGFIGFSIAAALVWFLAWLAGRKWKRWPAYLVGVPIFLFFLFFVFEHVNRLLPAAY